MGGDSRIGKCCCAECVWNIISTTSAHLLSHCPSAGTVATYGAVVGLSTPSGVLPHEEYFGNNRLYPERYQDATNHWHATIRNELIDIAPGDRAGGWVFLQSANDKFTILDHQELFNEVTCQEVDDAWDAFILTADYTNNPTWYDKGIPQDSRLFWSWGPTPQYSYGEDSLTLIFYDASWSATTYRRLWYEDTLTTTRETAIGETDSYSNSAQYASKAFCAWTTRASSWERYFYLMKLIQ